MSEPAAEKDWEQTLRSAVGKMALAVDSGDYLDSGDVAELRRISPDQPVTPALWKLIIDLELEGSPYWLDRETREDRWATLAMGLASAPGLHNYDTPLGEALAESGWSELRFVRLVRASGEHLTEEVRRMAKFLASKDQEADWTDVGHLLFSQTGDPAESYRRQVARDYYSALQRDESDDS